jgi:hypothetical protein
MWEHASVQQKDGIDAALLFRTAKKDGICSAARQKGMAIADGSKKPVRVDC